MKIQLNPSTPSSIIDALGKLGSAIVGLSAFSYIAGLTKINFMYGAIDASWLVEFATTQDILRNGLEPLAMVAITGLASVYVFSSTKWIATKLISFLLASFLLLYFNLRPPESINADWLASYKSYKLVCHTLYLISGTLIGHTLFIALKHKIISRATAFSFLTGALLSLYITPKYLGTAWATNIITKEIKLAKAIGAEYKDNDCYLLGNINSKYIIGCIKSEKLNKIQIIEPEKEIFFSQES